MIDQLISEGWEYRDLPRLSPEFFQKFCDIVGNENIKWLSLAEYHEKDGSVSQRGQLLVSPDGFTRLREYNERGDA